MKRQWIVICSVTAFGLVLFFAINSHRQDKGPASHFRTAEAKIVDATASISASGTIVPEDTIDVGSHVNGLVASFSTDVNGNLWTIERRSLREPC
jgi:multidrug efflux pump subunit AcrA (membrane-fusion protein)